VGGQPSSGFQTVPSNPRITQNVQINTFYLIFQAFDTKCAWLWIITVESQGIVGNIAIFVFILE
jgi:hypothetical protein